jgi:hypothetical protein
VVAFYKTAASGDAGSSVTIGITGVNPTSAIAGAYAYRPNDRNKPMRASGNGAAVTGTSATVSATGDSDDDLIVTIAGAVNYNAGGIAISAAVTGATLRDQVSDTTAGVALAVGDDTSSGASTRTVTVTSTGTYGIAGISLALGPNGTRQMVI